MGVRLMGRGGCVVRLMVSGELVLDSLGAVNGCYIHGELWMGFRLMEGGARVLDS